MNTIKKMKCLQIYFKEDENSTMFDFFKKIILQLRGRVFSKRVIFTYSLVIFIPLLIILFLIQFVIANKMTQSLENQCRLIVSDNAQIVQENVNSIFLINKMIDSNNDLNFFLYHASSLEEDELIDNIIKESVTLERILSVEQNISSIRVFSTDEHFPERFPIFLHSTRSDVESNLGWQFNYIEDYFKTSTYNQNYLAFFSRPIYYGKNLTAYLRIEVFMDEFFPFLYNKVNKTEEEKYSIYHNDCLYKVDRNAKTLIPIRNLTENIDDVFNCEIFQKKVESFVFDDKIKNKEHLTTVMRTPKGKFIVSMEHNKDLDMYIVHTCDYKINSNTLFYVFLASFIFIILITFVFVLLIGYISVNLLSGVYSIVDGMEEIRKGNFDVKIAITSNDEISKSQETFNVMVEQLNSLINQIKVEQRLITDTEMKAMLNQINAHFLYNVLETIRMQALLNDDLSTSESILILGKMMRYCLRWRVNRVTIEQEMEYISSYVYILNIRNDYEITLKTDIDEKYFDFEIPKMLLQPFIENAFYYAIEPLAKDAEIKIFLEEDFKNKILWICIQDFGEGMPEEKVQEIYNYLKDDIPEKEKTGSIGFKNIQQRLSILYGQNYRLQIISKQNEGTLIRIPIPLGEFENDNNSDC